MGFDIAFSSSDAGIAYRNGRYSGTLDGGLVRKIQKDADIIVVRQTIQAQVVHTSFTDTASGDQETPHRDETLK